MKLPHWVWKALDRSTGEELCVQFERFFSSKKLALEFRAGFIEVQGVNRELLGLRLRLTFKGGYGCGNVLELLSGAMFWDFGSSMFVARASRVC